MERQPVGDGAGVCDVTMDIEAGRVDARDLLAVDDDADNARLLIRLELNAVCRFFVCGGRGVSGCESRRSQLEKNKCRE